MTDLLQREAQRDATAAVPHRADRPFENESLHRIVVVGGGAARLELVTRLGDRVGRRHRASVTLLENVRTHLWKPLLYEVAAGSMDPGEHEVNYLAQAHWHGFRYRLGEPHIDRPVRTPVPQDQARAAFSVRITSASGAAD